MFQLVQVSSAQEIAEFHAVQDIMYLKDPLYVKPMLSDVEHVFDRTANPAFKDGDAVRFLLKKDGIAIGRVAAFYRIKKEGKMGGMGYFECIDDKEAAFALFDACKTWLIGQECTYMDGPVNFGDRDTFWGLLVENHTYPSYRENYNPSYYRAFFEAYGFEKEIEQSTSEITEDQFNFERFTKLSDRVMQSGKYTFVTIDWAQKEKFARDFATIYNEAWAHHEDFKPLSQDMVMTRLKQLKPVLMKQFAVFAYAGERPIGFYISMLEVNQLFRSFKGKMSWWNKLQFILRRGNIDKVRGIIFGVVPNFQNLGIETGLIMKCYEGYKNTPQIKVAELAWIGDFNPKMLSMLVSLGAHTTKIHYTFRKYF